MLLEPKKMQSPLKEKWQEDIIRYSSVWEDFNCLDRALATTTNYSRILSIGSAGDNAISLLKYRPRHLTILDISAAQTSLVELKLNAIKTLSFEEFLELLGHQGTPESRMRLFERVADHLGDRSLEFWISHIRVLEDGIVNCGRLDSYFKKFRDYILPQIWPNETLAKMTMTQSLREQLACWQSGDIARLKTAVGEFFSKSALSLEGRHASQFEYVSEENIGPKFLQNFMRLIQTELISANPYLYLFLTGRALTGATAVPIYNKMLFNQFKTQSTQVELVALDLETYLSERSQKFDFMNLSDIFEYLSDEQAYALFEKLADHLEPGGLLAYWTLLVDREPLCSQLQVDRDLSKELTKRDRTWFYSAFKIARRL